MCVFLLDPSLGWEEKKQKTWMAFKKLRSRRGEHVHHKKTMDKKLACVFGLVQSQVFDAEHDNYVHCIRNIIKKRGKKEP